MLAVAVLLLARPWTYEVRHMEGWTVKVRSELLGAAKEETEGKLKLVRSQLQTVAKLVPATALKELRRVTVYVSPEYPGTPPRAEYHPDAGWLREHGRDPEMAKGVEVTNMRILKEEIDRMPVFLLHELAHAYHDRVLGFDNPRVIAAYTKAKDSRAYDDVERWNGSGRPVTHERAYAMTNAQEYFAEGTEAFFARNDFYPFNRSDLHRVDPGLESLLDEVWTRSTGQKPSSTTKTIRL
ncbi:MAG: hypothetical protein KF857_06135 [Fimbriimonadaceae bacterium]|nr:hypothetical protein [Fimbriimonadaceae bacterium]